ncbi:complement C4-B isoform X2 [Antennarius striatus]|uniref:complement C4-B isoform X2 n=1 Tax=Antennarius striatus TaxID=241820 RepID=UPI0035B2E0D9
MRGPTFFTMFLIFTMESESSLDDTFFISSPGVFHVGVNKRVVVQMGKRHLNQPVTLYLEREVGSIVVSKKKTVVCAEEGEIKMVDLKIERDLMPERSNRPDRGPPYLVLVAESPSFSGRKKTRVLVSNRQGNIFIQTDQPIYSPTQIVRYRMFTLDHAFRPNEGEFHISVFNAAGSRIMTTFKTAKGGILQGTFHIPDVSKLGIWKITAHFEDDVENVASRDFKVQKFVLPSFEVNIEMKQNYILLKDEQVGFTISAKYSHGEYVKGAYHCRFGVVEKGTTPRQTTHPVFIRGLELMGSVLNGIAETSLQTSDLILYLQNQTNSQTLSELQRKGSQLYLGVFVTNIQSGEMQEAEVYIPIIAHRYTIDLSRTRSHFLPGYPLDVVTVVRLPDGSPAVGVPVNIQISTLQKKWEGVTDQEGTVFPVFNFPSVNQIAVEVSVDGLQQRKIIQRASSPSNSYLYLNIKNRIHSVGESLTVDYNTLSGNQLGFIYYMVVSRGILIKSGSLKLRTSIRNNLEITSDMVPSFRLIGYFYDQGGNIIADSVWVNVRDECEINVKVERKGSFEPGKQSTLEFDLHGRKARVALLAVDKAFYALHVNNKLTAKQVFSSMQSYDVGCSHSGGSDPGSVLTDAGLSFVSQSQSMSKRSFECESSARHTRSVDLQQEMASLKSTFYDEKQRECCIQGFSLIPMKLTCVQRAERVFLLEGNSSCTDAFLECCLKGERLRRQKIQEDAEKGFSRTNTADIDEFFLDTAAQYIRRFFPPSFAFTEFDINRKGRYYLALPDSITTWEIQVITLSADTGFCVVEPTDLRAFKNHFVSLRLPYSVRKYEQISISPVIYNYGHKELQVAVHMEQTKGLCSPGSATTKAFVNITIEPQSSQFVSFSAVPMVTGSIPITIRLYDIKNKFGIDAIQKLLKVWTEGIETRMEETHTFKLDGRSTNTFTIDGSLPVDAVPESNSNIFISAEGDGFGISLAKSLLSPQKVSSMIVLPTGCLEQTMSKLAPTASAIRYLDLSNQWFDLPVGARDEALDKLEDGFIHITGKRKPNGAYGTLMPSPYSNWMTAFVVKVLSLAAERQTVSVEQQGRKARFVPIEDIRHPVRYLLLVQEPDGSFGDPHPVLHRGVMNNKDQKASMTAFITLALQRSLRFLTNEGKTNTETSILRSTSYLLSHFEKLQHPYAVAITAYCLTVCLPNGTDHSSIWLKLQALATEGKNSCYLWTADANPQNSDAITVGATAYALLTAVELQHTMWADKTACWLTSQENYLGGFRSTQDTFNALEALAEYELKRSVHPEANLIAEFTVAGKSDIIKIALEKRKDKVEKDLKKFIGNNIHVKLTGNGNIKLKILRAYHLLEPRDDCNEVAISVTVEGKVKYTGYR